VGCRSRPVQRYWSERVSLRRPCWAAPRLAQTNPNEKLKAYGEWNVSSAPFGMGKCRSSARKLSCSERPSVKAEGNTAVGPSGGDQRPFFLEDQSLSNLELRRSAFDARSGFALHHDGIVRVAGDIPAGIIVAVGEERTSTGHIFFRSISVHFQIKFAVLVGNRKHAVAMDRTSGGTEFRINDTKGVGEKVDGVDQNA